MYRVDCDNLCCCPSPSFSLLSARLPFSAHHPSRLCPLHCPSTRLSFRCTVSLPPRGLLVNSVVHTLAAKRPSGYATTFGACLPSAVTTAASQLSATLCRSRSRTPLPFSALPERGGGAGGDDDGNTTFVQSAVHPRAPSLSVLRSVPPHPSPPSSLPLLSLIEPGCHDPLGGPVQQRRSR